MNTVWRALLILCPPVFFKCFKEVGQLQSSLRLCPSLHLTLTYFQILLETRQLIFCHHFPSLFRQVLLTLTSFSCINVIVTYLPNLILFSFYIHLHSTVQNHTHIIICHKVDYFLFSLVPSRWWQLGKSADFACSSSWPFQVSVFFKWLYDRMAQTEVAARQLCHTATGVSRACVSYKMINVLFLSNYINELFIIKSHIGTVIDKDTSVCCQCRSISEIWMSEANSTDRHSSAFPSCLGWVCGVCVRGLY